MPVHGRLDDLESFYHVLFWVSLKHARHGFHPVDLYDGFTRLFEHALIYGEKAYSNNSKSSHMKSTDMLEDIIFLNHPLRELLLRLSVAFKVLYISPPTSNKIVPPARKAQQAGESYQTELENYNEELRFLNSDDDPKWMEAYFEEALQYSDNEWGLTGYISNKMTPPGGTFLPSD